MIRTRRPSPTAPSVFLVLVLAAWGVACASYGSGSDPTSDPEPPGDDPPPTVQPGAPGEATRTVAPTVPEDRGLDRYSEADVRFMQGMIPHHAQALEMTALVTRRTSNEAIGRLALRMEISQRDEIALMERWLRERGEELPEPGSHAHHAGRDAATIPGMLSDEQMARLAAAEGRAFDRLFLELMIRHHEGALQMVEDLLGAPGGGQASDVFQFASHVEEDQQMEIDRMRAMLRELERAPEP